MSLYVHPSKQLRDDELPPELVVNNRDGSVEQVYVPYNASDQLEAENAKLRELVDELYPLADYGAMDASELDRAHDLMRELGIEEDA